MLRQIVLASIVVSGLSFVSMPAAQAHTTFQQCLDKAAKEHRQNLAAGMSRIAADAVWQSEVNKCRRIYKRASVGELVATSVPRSERPGRRFPNPAGNLLISRIVDAFDNSQGQTCDRVIKTQCRRGTIIRSLPPVWMTQTPDPSVPEGQNPGSIYPGLPPAPTSNLVAFNPPDSNPYPRRNGNGAQGSGAARLQASLLLDLVQG